jgi:hypothetical protein
LFIDIISRDNTSVYSLDFDTESMLDESINKNDKCFTEDGEPSLVGEDAGSEAPNAEGVSFLKSSISISKSKSSKKSLISILREESTIAAMEGSGSNRQAVRIQRGRRGSREADEGIMSRSQSI